VTFTNKAAGEMRDRVENLLGVAPSMWILTFHSACLRILRYHADALGYGTDFTVYDPTDQKTLIKNITKELNYDSKKFPPAMFLSQISKCKEQKLGPEGFIKTYGSDYKTDAIYQVYKRYQQELKKNNAMDFDDLLLNAVKLFEKEPQILAKYQDRFRYIMVDEYQDTNMLQYQFVRSLAEKHNNICVVGDDDQCIYQWRGADLRNILEFEKDFPDAKVVKLEQNYRSTSNILDAAHSVIVNNKGRKAKKLWTSAGAGKKIIYKRAEDEREEAAFIASEINRLKTRDRKYSDFAILYRTNAQSRTFEEQLSRREIPYRV
ncbi:MAG: UvrD-helicase domain-containing protein, partial [Firmicutes bacterium]|nr:UvrD-helicase domain-containing protein [Bacillota bacterium]